MANTKDLTGSIITALVITVFVVIAALIVSTVLSNSVFTDIPTTGTTSDDEVTFALGNYTLSIESTHPTAECSNIEIINSTGGEEIIGNGNYTFYYPLCIYEVQADSAYLDSEVNVSYDYSYASGTSLAGVNSTEISEDFGEFVTNLIAFLAIVGTIIGVVWLVYYVRRLFDKDGLQNISA